MEKYNQYEDIANKCKKIYLRFFYGDNLTDFEKDVEQRYLVQKQRKYMKWLGSGVICLYLN
jgi:hypothetical protein